MERGTAVQFVTNTFNEIRVFSLDSAHALILWLDATSYYLMGRLATISGSTITYGTATTIISTAFGTLEGTLLDSTHIVFSAKSSNLPYAYIITIAGDYSFSAGSSYQIDTILPTYIKLTALSTTKFLVVWTSITDYVGYARIGTVSSGNVISFGAEQIILSAGSYDPWITALSDTLVLYIYANMSDNYAVNIKALSISGDTIIIGTSYLPNGAGVTGLTYSPMKISGTTALMIQARFISGSVYYTYGAFISVSGTTITQYSVVYIASWRVNYAMAVLVDDPKFVVSYMDLAYNDYGEANSGSYSGTSLTFDQNANEEFTTAVVDNMHMAALDATHVIVVYDTSSGAYAIVLSAPNLLTATQNGAAIDLAWSQGW